jgi:hypothetical protein
MKTLVIVSILVGFLAIIGIATASIGNDEVSVDQSPETCTQGQGCPSQGGCSAGNNCGLSTCGATKGSSCGCGGR